MTGDPPGAAPAARHVYLVDASGFIFRAFHALPPLHRSDGTPTNAVLGFVNMLMKLLAETDADHIGIVFDGGSATFRNELYPDYKANRGEPPEELVPQFALVREATDAFGLPRVELAGFEADDLIATYARLAREAGAEVTIVSSDKDLMQLVGDGVIMFDPIKMKPIGPEEVREKFGVGPERVVDVQALCGDAVDNVPGVPGIGVKTAAELINRFGDLETLLERAGEITQPKRRQTLIENAEKARLSKTLVRLDANAPTPVPLDAFRVRAPDRPGLVAYLKGQEFRRVAQRVEAGEFRPKAAADAAPDPSMPAAGPLPQAAEALYELVGDLATLDRWIAAATASGMIGLHVATPEGERALEPIVGIALAVAPGLACYVPLGHRPPAIGLDLDAVAPPANLPLAEVLARLAPLLGEPGTLKVGHDVKRAIRLLGAAGLDLAPYDCIQLMSYVEAGAKHAHDLGDLAARHLGVEPTDMKALLGSGRARLRFDELAPDRALKPAAEAADLARRLHPILAARLRAERLVAFYERVERPLPAVVAAMERRGIRVDETALRDLSTEFAGRIAALETEIFELAGLPFTIGSPKQLGEVLFDKLQLPGGKKGKTGAYGTDVTVLEQLAGFHPLPQKVLDWRQISKLKVTYADALVGEIGPETRRVHTSFDLAATLTGRFSSREPNLQNIPVRTEEGQRIRRCFVAEPGSVLLSADYSQIELRLAAHFGDVETLKEAFRQGTDIHAVTASEVFGVPLAELDGGLRRRAKTINFGILYGISAFGLAQRLGMTQGDAAAYISAYFAKFPGVRAYMDRMKSECRENGFVETLFGRRCHIPGIRDANPARRQFAERQAINAPLQGSAADIIKRAMARVERALAAAGLGARLLLQVHDELLFEVPEAEAERTAALVKAVMEEACAPSRSLSVPLVVDTGWAADWDAAH